MCGDEHIDSYMVEAVIRFSPSDWETTSSTPSDFRALLREMLPTDLRRLLRLGTAQCSLPRSNSRAGNDSQPGMLTIQRCPASERLPVGRTCFRRIDIPDYCDREMLRQKLVMCLSSLDEGFDLH
mmetsp:Transcript_7395/g.18820  ORF Transcript_7395/g.18820 Transcript_7395/m.18820 type:complete len:125 (+) Transcript_7395:190-564(+)